MRKVRAANAAASRNSGIFSARHRRQPPGISNRRNGQKSISSRANGRGTTVAFDISPDLRRKTETEAQTKAIAAFRKKAEEITHDFGFRSYSLREASVQADHVYGGPMPRMRMVEAKAYSNDATPLPTEPGKSTVRVVVQGSVQMQ